MNDKTVPNTQAGWKRPSHCQFVPTRRTLVVKVVRSIAELEAIESQWILLAENSIESNVFYDPMVLLPALRYDAARETVFFVLVFAVSAIANGETRTLVGLFPLQRIRQFKGMPFRGIKLWHSDHFSLCTPLVRADYARDCLDCFFQWLRTDRVAGSVCILDTVSAGGHFTKLLADIRNDRLDMQVVDESYNRAVLENSLDAESYIAAALSTKRRKELRRLERLLGEAGAIRYELISDPAQVEHWLSQFLTLEASGWKGREGSALGMKADRREYFSAIVRSAAGRGRLMMLALTLDGAPIAMKCNLRDGDAAFSLKIAFSEKYARYSPGVLLELENIRRCLVAGGPQWMDSCATARHPMINNLWLSRGSIQTVWIATGRGFGNLLVALLPMIRLIKRSFKSVFQTGGRPAK